MIGCTTSNKEWDYLGVTPYYAVSAPHPADCACCGVEVWQPPFKGAERQLRCECCPDTDWTEIALPQK